MQNPNLARCEGDSGRKKRAKINKMTGAVQVLLIRNWSRAYIAHTRMHARMHAHTQARTHTHTHTQTPTTVMKRTMIKVIMRMRMVMKSTMPVGAS